MTQKIKEFSKKDKLILKTANKIADIFKDSDTPITETIIEVGNALDSLDNWISIKTELPKICDTYRVFTEGRIMFDAYYDSICGFTNTEFSVQCNYITYWQNLPQPPKQSTKKHGGCNP